MLFNTKEVKQNDTIKQSFDPTSSMKIADENINFDIENEKVSDYWLFEVNQENPKTYDKKDSQVEKKPKNKRNRNRSMKSTISSDLKRRDLK